VAYNAFTEQVEQEVVFSEVFSSCAGHRGGEKLRTPGHAFCMQDFTPTHWKCINLAQDCFGPSAPDDASRFQVPGNARPISF
jgi:hypothetical protein